MVGVIGFEPTTPSPPAKCATKLRYTPTEEAQFTEFLFVCNAKYRKLLSFVHSLSSQPLKYLVETTSKLKLSNNPVVYQDKTSNSFFKLYRQN